MFELLLFRLGDAANADQRAPQWTGTAASAPAPAAKLSGINVVQGARNSGDAGNPVARSSANILGVADIRGQIIPMIDLARIVSRAHRRLQAEARAENLPRHRIRAHHARLCGRGSRRYRAAGVESSLVGRIAFRRPHGHEFRAHRRQCGRLAARAGAGCRAHRARRVAFVA